MEECIMLDDRFGPLTTMSSSVHVLITGLDFKITIFSLRIAIWHANNLLILSICPVSIDLIHQVLTKFSSMQVYYLQECMYVVYHVSVLVLHTKTICVPGFGSTCSPTLLLHDVACHDFETTC
ncbi:hypothetical protein ACSBR2_042555 [Camellia fascicularis]